MICQKCQSEIDDKAKFCPECGAPISRSPIVPMSEPATEEIAEAKPAGEEQAQDKVFLKFIGACLLIVAVIVWWESARPTGYTSTTQKTQVITLCADEKGDYGEMFTLNKGTEFEESYYIYRVPAGTYTITNTGKYMDQFSVYGEKVYVTDDGWEELSDVVYVKALQPNESDTVTISDGQIIEIHGSGTWKLKLK